MRREFGDHDCLGKLFDHMPNNLLTDTISPGLSCRAYTAKKFSGVNVGGAQPRVQFRMDPIRDRNRPDVPTLPDGIDNCPMALPLLKVIDSQFGNLMPPQSAREEESEQCAIALAFEPLSVWRLPEQLRLLRCQPVAGTHAQLFEALHATDTSRQICAQEAAIGSFVRETPDSPKAEIDRPWREVAGLKVHTISQNDSLAKRQARLRVKS